MSAVSAGVSEVLIKYTGKYVKIYFIIKITYICICCVFVVFPFSCLITVLVLLVAVPGVRPF